MDSIGLREIKDLKELGGVYCNDKEIADKANTSRAIKNIKKPVVAVSDSGTINKKTFDIRVQKSLRELKNPAIVNNVRDKLEHIEQELLYNNYDAAVERIIETLKYLENVH